MGLKENVKKIYSNLKKHNAVRIMKTAKLPDPVIQILTKYYTSRQL